MGGGAPDSLMANVTCRARAGAPPGAPQALRALPLAWALGTCSWASLPACLDLESQDLGQGPWPPPPTPGGPAAPRVSHLVLAAPGLLCPQASHPRPWGQVLSAQRGSACPGHTAPSRGTHTACHSGSSALSWGPAWFSRPLVPSGWTQLPPALHTPESSHCLLPGGRLRTPSLPQRQGPPPPCRPRPGHSSSPRMPPIFPGPQGATLLPCHQLVPTRRWLQSGSAPTWSPGRRHLVGVRHVSLAGQ